VSGTCEGTVPLPSSSRTVARVFNSGLCSSGGGLDIIKLTKTPLIYSVSRSNLGGLRAWFGGS